MLQTATLFLITAFVTGTPVSVSTLDGKAVQGDLISLDTETLTVSTAAGEQKLACEDLMLVRLTGTNATGAKSFPVTIRLIDGSLLHADQVRLEGDLVVVDSTALGEMNLPILSVKTLQLAETDDQVSASWDDIQSRNVRDDLLVFRKENVLDYVGGSISKVSDESVSILVRNREMAAPRERVFGVVFANRSATQGTPLVEMKLDNGNRLRLKSVLLKDKSLHFELLSGTSASVELKQVESFDFGGGRLKYLADLPFDASASVSPHPETPVNWFVTKNFPAGSGGRLPLTIGQQTFDQGLWLHSGANLRFRLNREFREFKATAGFELTHPQRMGQFSPKVKLVLLGDGKELYAKEFGWQDSPEELSIDLSSVREFVVRVDSLGQAQGVLEHFALGDAQVIK